MTPLRPLALLLAAAALVAAGCGSSSKDKNAKTTESAPATSTPAPAATTTTSSSSASAGTVSVANAKDLAHKPKLGKPQGDPPPSLVKKDLVVGHGPAAKAGNTVSVQYVGISWSTGKQFDASWDRGAQPFVFPLGAGQVIQGWDTGVPGMKVGGRRELVIPPDQGYGPQGSPPSIGPNETLVFVVDLKRIG
jgi:peptidylprolyl isomerase